jgi:2-Cys peroxiredoxin 5
MRTGKITAGSRIPNVLLAYIVDGKVSTISTETVFAGKRSIVLGVPGAFTPVCTKQHIPDFVANADKLLTSGYDQLVCVAPNDPFVLAEWSERLDPKHKVKFLSDGNTDFAVATGLQTSNRELFLSGRCERYMMVVDNNIVGHVRIEPSIGMYSCTRAQDIPQMAQA